MNAAPLVVTPGWSVLRVVGPDAASWLNGIVTCDTATVAPGRAVLGLVLSKTGKVQAEVWLVGSSADLWIVVSGGDAAKLEATLQHYLVMEDAELSAEPDFAAVAVYGVGAELPTEWAGSSEIPGGRLSVVARAEVARLVESARRAGAELASEGARWDERRVQLGLPAYGVDYGERDNPHEAALDRRAVSWSKGCYLGQEVVCMQDMRGKVKRRLVRLEPLGMEPTWEAGSPVLTAESAEPVGRVTTAAAGRAIATVSAPWFEPGQQVVVGGQPVRVLVLAND